MSENDNNGRKPLTLKPRTGGSVSSGTVKQSFSHGRTKTVVVETKRARPHAQAGGNLAAPSNAERRAYEPQRPAAPQQGAGRPTPNDGLSAEERAARQRVIEAARARQAQEEADRRAGEERQRAEDAARAAQAQAQAAAANAAAQAAAAPQTTAPTPVAAAPVQAAPAAPAPAPSPRRPGSGGPAPAPALRLSPRRTRPQRLRPRRRAPPRRLRRRRARPAPPRRRPTGATIARPPPPTVPTGPPPAAASTARRSISARRDATTIVPVRRAVTTTAARAATTGPRAAPRAGLAPKAEPSAIPRLRPGPRRADPAPWRTRRSRGPRIDRPPRRPRPEVQRRLPGAARRADHGLPRRGRSRRANDAGKGAISRAKGAPNRREGRLTIQAVAGDAEGAERMRSLASVRRAREREREKRKGGAVEQARVAREVIIPDVITVGELANRMATRGVEIIKFLMRQGVMLKINDVIDNDTAELVATEFGHTVRRVSESDVEEGFIGAEDLDDHLEPRPPVVTALGHGDHGKTSLRDALRSTDGGSGEHGGGTQHIGAYQVRLENGQRVTFLDTPGHAAFSAMRARGANATDIVILVVAADDGVMPQTVEAIQHAKAAGAPIIVAINKIDKPDADPTRVINELLQHEIVVESLGGDTQAVEVSARQQMGLGDLIENSRLQAEVLDLRANPDRIADGMVIEAKLDKGRGAVSTVLVKRGTLKRGDIVAGANFGRVRALLNERGEQLDSAGPSVPVEILGLDGTPDPGEPFAVVENEARARELTEYRTRVKREKAGAPVASASLADMMAKLADKKVSELPVIIKADVQGSAEAIVGSLDKLATDEVRARIILSGAGGINESDVLLAKGAGAPILGFNVRASKQARDLAEREGVEIRYYAIIYDLIDDIKGVLSGMLAPIQRETFLGNAEVLQAFDITKVGRVAGCRVTEGVVRKGARVRIVRDNVVILELGVLKTLKRFKDEVNEVPAGQECGMAFEGFQDIKAGDTIECFNLEEVKRSL